MKIRTFLLFLPLISLGCGHDYEPDCDYILPKGFLITENDGKYLIHDNSEMKGAHVISRGMNFPPMNVFEVEIFDDSCQAKGFLKKELRRFEK